MPTESSSEQQSFNLTPLSRAIVTACGATVAATAAPGAMAQDGLALEEIVVTARKRSENLQDVPISVQAFGTEAIAKQGIRNLEDYARVIPSLTYSSWLPGSSIVVFRGVTVAADAFSGSSSSAMYFNEVAITAQGQNPEVATFDMERIEAVSGPQPTTYGASAQSGVLKFVTAKPNLSDFGGYVDVGATFMEEGDAGYDLHGAINIPIVEDKFALRISGKQERVGGYVDNVAGTTEQTHDWDPVFASYPAAYSYPGGFNAPTNLVRHTKSNHAVAEDDIGDIDTRVMRLTAAWAPNEDWLITGLYNYQQISADGIAAWHPEIGDLQQIRFKQETKDDDWYLGSLVIEGDLGFADFTSATGYMERDIVYDLDSSTYLHQFQGIGGVYYNMLDVVYGSVYTYAIPAYNGSITGWTNAAPYLYYITDLSDVTSRMVNFDNSNRFSQELRLSSKEDQRFQWMIGGYYEKWEGTAMFRGILDDFDKSIGAPIILQKDGFVVRNPAQSWFGNSAFEDTEWSVFGEIGVNFTDNLNVTVGARYFEADSFNQDMTLNADGTQSQTCAEDAMGNCILDPSRITEDNRIGIGSAQNAAKNSDTLPLARITYTFNEDIMAYATYAEGFRTGGTNIIRATSSASPKFEADKVINHELGFKSTLMDGRLVFNLAAYHMVWEDMQMVAADPTISFGWGQVTVNTGRAEIDGTELNFAFAATEGLRFDGAFSYTTSEVTEGASIGGDVVIAVGEQLPLSPRIKWNLGAEYGFPTQSGDSYVRVDYSFTDEQTNATEGSTLLTSSTLLRGTITTMPSYSIANLIAGYDKDNWGVRFAINNIADERAVTYVPTRWTDGRQYSVRPREFRVSFRYNW